MIPAVTANAVTLSQALRDLFCPVGVRVYVMDNSPRLQPGSQIRCPHRHGWHDVIAVRGRDCLYSRDAVLGMSGATGIPRGSPPSETKKLDGARKCN